MLLLLQRVLSSIFSALLVVCLFSATTGTTAAEYDEAKHSVVRRQLQQDEPGPVECTPYLVVGLSSAEDEDDEEDDFEEWLCESDPEDEESGTPLLYDIQGIIYDTHGIKGKKFKNFLEDNGLESGNDSIKFTKATKSGGRGTTKGTGGHQQRTITVHTGSGVVIQRGAGRGRQNHRRSPPHQYHPSRHLAPKEGINTALVVRVSTPTPDPPVVRTYEQLQADMFGLGNHHIDTFHMVSRMDACSGGKLQIVPAPDTTTGITNGVLDVMLNITIVETGGVDPILRKDVENMAREEVVQKIGLALYETYDHIMFTWTRKYTKWNALAYAQLNGKISAYRDNRIYRPSIQMHELAHNYGLMHSGEVVTEPTGPVIKNYGDHTCLMGNPG